MNIVVSQAGGQAVALCRGSNAEPVVDIANTAAAVHLQYCWAPKVEFPSQSQHIAGKIKQ